MIEQASLVIGEGNWAVKSDSLLGYKINGGKYYPREMSVVRATTGTRINEDGLVEVVPYNLAQYSEQFDNAWWVKYQANVTANNTTAPNGTTTADKVTASTNGATVVYRSETYLVSGVYNFSIYVKAGNQDKIYLEAYGVGGTACSVNFNLTTQTIISPNNFTNVNIENVGNGWFRISATFSNLGGSIVTFGFGMAISVSTNDFAYFWGAQLNEGSSALDYLPTTDRLDVARIDYSSGSAALLVEPQRTNLLTYSSSFDNAAWSPQFIDSISANSAISPSGVQDADKIIPSTATNLHYILQSQKTTGGAAFSTYYVKAGGYYKCGIREAWNGTNWASFNINDGTIISQSSGSNATIESVGNGWYRIGIYSSGTTQRPDLYVLDNAYTSGALDSYNFAGDGTSGIFAWGAQLEAGSYPTSLIPTQGSTVTRNADVISKTGIADLIGQTEGTLFLEYPNFKTDGNEGLVGIDDGSGNNRILFYSDSNNRITAQVRTNGVTQQPSSYSVSGNVKVAIAYNSSGFVFYVNGTLRFTGTAVVFSNAMSVFTFNHLGITASITNAAALWKTRLTNAQLATLTTI